MDLKLNGKTAFITGSTAGIGFATAEILARKGVKVILNGRTKEGIDKAIEKLKTKVPNARLSGIAMDFSTKMEIKKVLEEITPVDILINNVGTYTARIFFETTDEDWNEQWEVNVMSGIRLSRYLLPGMIKRGWGRILFVSSECATLVPSDLIAYSTTKAALLSLSRGLAQLTKGTEVTVNTIIPGSTRTEGALYFLEARAIAENKSRMEIEQDFFKEVRKTSLIQRFATPDKVANTIAYYASPLAAATNGSTIRVDGGSMGGIL